MTVYSWNMLFRNKRLDEALSFIRDSGADVFCLQEVPVAFLERLETLPYSFSAHVEADLAWRHQHVQLYTVTLSRFPIVHTEAIELPPYVQPVRGRIFAHVLYLFGMWGRAHEQRRFTNVSDIDIGGRLVRVFNLHLRLAYPALRLEEFERVMLEREPDMPVIVCGDLNIIESPRISMLNWLFGGTLADSFLYARERTSIERRFAEHEFSSPLRGCSTHPLSRSQLDHILVSPHFSVAQARVISDRIGSDHHPISVELT